MSKRFGRNQKRKLKKELAEAQRNAGVLSSRANYYAQQNEPLQAQLEQVRSILGNYFVGLEPTIIRSNLKSTEMSKEFELPGVTQLACTPFDSPAQNKTIESVPLNSLLMRLKPIDIENMQHMMHCRVEYADKVWAYNFSREVLKIPREILARRIAKELSEAIVNELMRHV